MVLFISEFDVLFCLENWLAWFLKNRVHIHIVHIDRDTSTYYHSMCFVFAHKFCIIFQVIYTYLNTYFFNNTRVTCGFNLRRQRVTYLQNLCAKKSVCKIDFSMFIMPFPNFLNKVYFIFLIFFIIV